MLPIPLVLDGLPAPRLAEAPMRGLYAIADVKTLAAYGVDVVAFVEAVAFARPAAIQLRAKELSDPEMLALLRALGSICRRADVPLVANDRVELAAQAGCEWVHLGQGDGSLEDAARVVPALRAGVSTHDLDQLSRALGDRPGYVAYGPVFPTASKANPDPVVGVAGLRLAHRAARAAGVPLVAIGGITLARAHEIAALADAGAVIAALLPERREPGERVDLDEVTARARLLHRALLGNGAPLAEAVSE
jgi:thiamine-phosphate pyrophosphorylase